MQDVHLGFDIIFVFYGFLYRVALHLPLVHGLDALLFCHHQRIVLLVHVLLCHRLELFQRIHLRFILHIKLFGLDQLLSLRL